jgi:hypothetical protein
MKHRAANVSMVATLVAVGIVVWASLASAPESSAIPAFARKYQTSCTTCHMDFPKLNDFGKAFKDAGFKFPSDDESFIKEPPVMLGAPALKERFPHTVWPGTIPGMPPIGFRFNSFFQFTGGNRGKFDSLTPAGSVPAFIPKTDFSSGLFSLFAAGNFGSDIAFWVDTDLNVGGENGAGGLGDAYLRFVNLSRFLRMPKDSFTMRVGRFELDLPFTQARSINLSPYDIYAQANIGAMNPAFAAQHNVNNQFTLADAANGIEFSGGHQYGGYHYSIAIVDQNTSGLSQPANTSPFVPSPTGGANGGIGFASDSNFKDLYGRLSYRFNLERDRSSRELVQAAGPTGPRDHTFLNVGTYYFYGRSVQRFSGENLVGDPVVLTAREPFYRVGGDFSFNYRTFNLFGLYMYGHDHNLLPVDITGTLVPLPITGTPAPVGFVRGSPATFSGGFLQVDYLALPWVMTIMRWDAVNSWADRINGLAENTSTPFVLPFRQTRNRFTPGVQFLIHANIKTSFEYQFRPRQFVTVITNPITGLPSAIQPFRTNTAVANLEFLF